MVSIFLLNLVRIPQQFPLKNHPCKLIWNGIHSPRHSFLLLFHLSLPWEISNTSLGKFAKPKLTLPTSIHPSRTRESNRIENFQNVDNCWGRTTKCYWRTCIWYSKSMQWLINYLVNQGCERMSSRRIRAAGERLRQPRMRSWASEDTEEEEEEEEGALASGKAILASQIWGDISSQNTQGNLCR